MAATWGGILGRAEEILVRSGVPEADLDAWWLFSDTFQISRAQYLLCRAQEASAGEDAFALWEERIRRRAEREPLGYILGNTVFMGLPFSVDRSVLIPRQDTETLAEWVLEEAGKRTEGPTVPLSLLDLCTGSGCIGLSLERLGGFRVTLTDVSEEALKTARKNRDALECCARILKGDLFEALPAGERFDLITCNPPYIRTADIDTLEEEVRVFEPRLALDGEEDGLAFYRRIAREAQAHLLPGGAVYLEIGIGQERAVPALLYKEGFRQIEVRKDLAGLPRVVRGRRPDGTG